MAELADSNGLRVLAYAFAALCTIAALPRERRRAPGADGVWHPFWLLTAGLLLTMAIGRLGDVAGLVTELGRSRATDEGWYASRRPFQAAIVGIVAATWFVTVTVAVWRVPERRRRYLPMSLVVITLIAFAAVRLVSFHYLDTVLYHRDLLGVRWAAVIELALIAVACVTTLWVPPPRQTAVADAAAHASGSRR